MELTPYQQDVINAKICPYCKSETKMMSELQVYGKIFKNRIIITCKNYPACDSYVGTHDDGMPLGRLANKTLRTAKRNAHNAFDKLWKEKLLDRDSAYEQLADHLEIPDKYTHIGMFSAGTCSKTIQWAKSKYKELKACINESICSKTTQ